MSHIIGAIGSSPTAFTGLADAPPSYAGHATHALRVKGDETGLEFSEPEAAPAGEAFPIGAVFIAVVPTDPATLLGYGTWEAFGAGRMLVGLDSGDPDFDAAEETGGSKTCTLTADQMPVHTHVQDSHNHTQNSHNHTQNAHNHTQDSHTHTQDAHTHVQDAHNHTQDAHTHTQNAHNHVIRSQTATTGSATSYEHGALDTSSAETEATEVTDNTTATNQNTTATNQAATATNQNATATNQATTATNQAATATNQAATATNQAATAVNQNAGGGQSHSIMNPFIVVFFWKRTA